MSMTRFTAVILMASLLTGCASSGNRWPSFAKRDGVHRDSGVRRNLKDPSKLDLAYAKWQEQLGNMTEARERYQRVLHDEPQSVDALLGLARMDQLAGRLTEAEQGFRKALKTSPGDPQVLDALGQFYAAQEKWPQAIDVLKQGLQVAPNDDTIRFHLAVATAQSGDLVTAKPHFVNSVGEAEAEYNLGLILHDQGKLELAEQHFVQAVVKKPTLEQAQYWLNEIRIEKETKNLLVGTSGSKPRPEMQAPAGALPTNTRLRTTEVAEQRFSPNDVLGIQQTAGQQPYSAPRANVAPATNTVPAANNWPATSRSANVSNPFATGTAPPALPAINGGLTPQQLEQLRNQR
ncbi:MAG: tetratricopeptide repeat protein [Planctomycetaceae bacterium]